MEQPQNQDGMNRLAAAAETFIKQERWSRRWTNMLKLAVIAYLVFLIALASGQLSEEAEELVKKDHVAVVKLDGPIMPSSPISANAINPLLNRAFKHKDSKAVVIQANSPGGSPVQSALIGDEIRRLKEKHNKPVYVVVEDMCASGCYYIAAAADEIYANQGSIIGSIGVRLDTFGLTGLMEKMGIENRSMHAGEHKTFIDPFSPKDEAGREFFQKHILERTHQQFIDVVKEGRGDRLKANEDTFTGLVWLGDESVELGLIDGLGDVGYVTRELVELDTVRYYEGEKSIMSQIMGDFGSDIAFKISQQLTGLK